MATSRSTTAKKPAAKPTAKTTTGNKVSAKSQTTKTAITRKPATPLAKTAAPAAAKKAAGRAAPAPRKTESVTPEQRFKMIQDAAYYMAEKDGFHGGSMDYWMAAEFEIEEKLSGKGKKRL